MNKIDEFSARKPRIMGEEQFRRYSVLLPLIKTSESTFLLFEKRSKNLRTQPGEICFPGGKLELNETMEQCAVRETQEELLITQQQIEIIGPGDVFVSPFNIMIYPFLGRIHHYEDTFSTDEVEKVIQIPLDFFRKQQPSQYENRLISKPPEDFPYEWVPGGENYPWINGSYDIFFYRYEEHIIWGMTAYILKGMLELMDEYKIYES